MDGRQYDQKIWPAMTAEEMSPRDDFPTPYCLLPTAYCLLPSQHPPRISQHRLFVLQHLHQGADVLIIKTGLPDARIRG